MLLTRLFASRAIVLLGESSPGRRPHPSPLHFVERALTRATILASEARYPHYSSGRLTMMDLSSTRTAYVWISWRAGPRNTFPVQTLNCAPCHGQVSTSPSSSPSLSGPPI